MGSIFAQVEEPDYLPFFVGRNADQLRNTKNAVKFVDKCNEKDRDVYTDLLKVYEHTKDKSKFNKLLDTMIKRFPEDKEFLIKTGLKCINRKVYLKGVRYLEQALKLDPLDNNTKESLISGYLHFARSNFKNKKIEEVKVDDVSADPESASKTKNAEGLMTKNSGGKPAGLFN